MPTTTPPTCDAARLRLAQVLDAVGGIAWSAEPGTLRLLHLEGDLTRVLGVPSSVVADAAPSLLTVVHPQDRPHVTHAIRELTGDPGRLACRIVDAAGVTRWVRSVLFPVTDDAGAVVRIDGVTTDITGSVEREEEQRETTGFLARINEVTRVGGWELDLDTGAVTWTRTARAIHGAPAGYRPTIEDVRDAVIDDLDRARLDAALESCARRGEQWDLELRLRTGTGEPRWVRVLGRRRDEPGPPRLYGAIQDIDAQVRARQELNASRQQLQLVLGASNDGWWDWDLQTDELHLSPRWYAMVGLDPDQHPATPQLLVDRVHPDDRAKVTALMEALASGQRSSFELEFRLEHAAGHAVPVLARAAVLCDPHPVRITGSNVDLSQLKRAEARHAALYRDLQRANIDLQRQARVDALTGVANRRGFDDFLEGVWARAQRGHLPVGLILCDVDHFKRFNDRLGHPEGDRCLTEVASSIRSSVRGVGDLVARYGGEEFAIVLPGTPLDEVVQVAERIRADLAALALPHPDSPVAPHVTLSLGAACLRPHPDEWSQRLITTADDALLLAKRRGRDRIEVGHTVNGSAALPAPGAAVTRAPGR